MKLLFIGDANPDKKFIDIMAASNINITKRCKKLGHLTGRRHFLRHLQYLIMAAYGVMRRKNFECVFIWQQYIGIYYYLLTLLWPFYKKPTVLFYVIYKKSNNRIINGIKTKLFLNAFNSGLFLNVIFINKEDYLYNHIHIIYRDFVHFYQQPSAYIENNLDKLPTEKRLFSGGVSNRNYRQLRELAEAEPAVKITIAGTAADKASLKPLPPNVNFVTGAYGDDFDRLLLESSAVIIPLNDPRVISGQLVILKALQAGKMIIMSENTFWSDWMSGRGKDDFIILYDGFTSLRNIITSLDEEMVRVAGGHARTFYKKELCPETMYHQLTGIILQQKCPAK